MFFFEGGGGEARAVLSLVGDGLLTADRETGLFTNGEDHPRGDGLLLLLKLFDLFFDRSEFADVGCFVVTGFFQLAVVAGVELLDVVDVDGVGRQFGTDAEKLMLFEVINSRYEALKATIVISNLSGDALMDYLGEAAMDRLREGGRSVLFDWTSYRRRGY